MMMTEIEEGLPSGKVSKESNRLVKRMERVSKIFVVDSYKLRGNYDDEGWPNRSSIGPVGSIDSYPFVVGGYTFTMHLYPRGTTGGFSGDVSLFIKNHSPKTALVSFHFFIFDSDITFSRNLYHKVVALEPGRCFGRENTAYSVIIVPYVRRQNYSIKFQANIGVVVFDQPPQRQRFDFERIILFQVGDKIYYAHESVITSQCPALLLYPQSDDKVVVSDIETYVFEAVLWFLNHKSLHKNDRDNIAEAKDSFHLKMIAAAEKLMLNDLGRLSKSLVNCWDSELVADYYETEANVKQVWGVVTSWLPQKMEELIQQKMKAA